MKGWRLTMKIIKVHRMNLAIDYNIEHDAWNYLRIYSQKEGSYGQMNIIEKSLASRPAVYQELFAAGLTPDELRPKLVQALTEEQRSLGTQYEEKISNLYGHWKLVGNQVEHFLSQLFSHPFPFADDTLTIHFTTLRSCPYKYEDRMIFCSLNGSTQDQIRIIIHELNHFMYYYYFGQLQKRLGNEKSELLKESLTVFSNPEQPPYPAARELVNLYTSRPWHSIDEAIEAGAAFLSN